MALDARQPVRSRANQHTPEFALPQFDAHGRPHSCAGVWPGVRGNILFRATVELSGGFPGSVPHAGIFRQARLAITEDWLIVNEGRPDGFALSLDSVTSFAIVPGTLRSRYALRVGYDQHDEAHFFYVRFPEPVWPFRAGDDALRMADLLFRLGIDDIDSAALSSIEEKLAATDATTRTAAMESMVWSGDVSAPVQGRKGQDRTRCQAWLTTASFIWKAIDGSGMHHLNLRDLARVHTGVWVQKEPYPVTMFQIRGNSTIHEVPFIFNAFDHIDDNRRECAAMLGGLRMREIAVSGQPRPLRPWQDMASLMIATDLASEPAPLPKPVAAGSKRVSPAEFEAQCLAEIARLNRDILGTPGEAHVAPVHRISQAVAMEEIERLYRSGEITRTERDKQRNRVTALIEARGKLAAIADQRAKGHRPRGILQHQREAVMDQLNARLIPDATPAAPPEPETPRLRLRLVK